MDLAVRAQKCVVFIGVRDPTYGTFIPLGTGFLVTKDEGGIRFQHVITARHVVDQVAQDSIWLRVNKISGGSELLETKKAHWHFAQKEKEYIDVAILPCVLGTKVFDLLHIDLGSDVLTPPTEPDPPELGLPICVVGLFTSHYGSDRNVPIVRFGNVAAIPDDPVLTEFGYMSGYLVELKSLGGMSGSPVIGSKSNYSAAPAVEDIEPAFLLGLMHGHFLIENPEDAIQVEGNDKSTGQINTGIGLVIPGRHILEALDLPAVAEGRKFVVEQLRKKSNVRADKAAAPTLRAASSGATDLPANGENPTHQEDFRRLVGAAARKQEPED
jgi:Trypsin-like peptidase domain